MEKKVHNIPVETCQLKSIIILAGGNVILYNHFFVEEKIAIKFD